MTHPQHESEDDGRPRPHLPTQDETWEDGTGTFDGEWEETGTATEAEAGPQPTHDPTVAPLAPTRRPIGAAAVIGTFVGTSAIISCIWFAIHSNWPAAIPAALVLLGVTLAGLRLIRGSVQDAEYHAALVAAEPILYPSPRVERSLSPGERLYIETHEHPLSIAPWVLLAIAVTCVAGWLFVASGWKVGASFWAVAMGFTVYRMALWERRIFCVTDRYIILIEGVFTTHENRMLIAKVTDARKVVPLHSKMLAWLRLTNLSYGTFFLETAGQEQAINKVGWLPGINQLTRITMALASGNRPDLPPDD